LGLTSILIAGSVLLLVGLAGSGFACGQEYLWMLQFAIVLLFLVRFFSFNSLFAFFFK